ncbi:MAG: SUF system NifU family Fe-S cluster assembly protein [Gammaproteobacteria bacterium]|nr:SUF system NifU family Fe-S cluster assembly protein [Gammaproteobacteria bacterium]
MSELRDLYQEVILDHNKNPRNFGFLNPHTHSADGHNPLCGDQIQVQLDVSSTGIIEAIRFTGAGCAISTASASIMTESLQGLSVAEAQDLLSQFQLLVTDSSQSPDPQLGKLAVLAGVRDYPMRIKCATLPWHTFQAALMGEIEASTE